MQSYRLHSLDIRMGAPVRVTAGVGHQWFPVIHRFAGGELIAQWSMMPDVHSFALLSGASHSTDGGRTWSPPYAMGNHANQCLSLPDGSLRRVPYYFYPTPATQKRVFTTDLATVWPGGRNEVVPLGATITLPRDAEVMATGSAHMVFTGTPIELAGRWLTTIYGAWNDDPRPADRHNYCLHVVASRDLGRTWEFVSTIAAHQQLKPPAPEGPCEASLCVLESGQVLCVYRVGSGADWRYRASRSDDACRTWSSPEILEGPGSVEPSLQRLANGTLALSGGRPTLKLWFADDKVGLRWQEIDLHAHHNQTCRPEERIATETTQTTCYTELVEAEPNRLLCIYDRCPLGWHAVPIDSPERGMIFVVEIEVRR